MALRRALAILAAACLACDGLQLGSSSSRRRTRLGPRRAARLPTMASAVSEAEVRVVSYNVLSSSLCEPSYFSACKPENLKPATRLKRVMDKLSLEVAQGSVICLQEVSMLWAGDLHSYFAQRGYHFVFTGYGGRKNGYMGVGIAYPTDAFATQRVVIKRISETKKWPYPPRPGRVRGVLKWARRRIKYKVVRPVKGLFGIRSFDPINPWTDARNRYNNAVFVELECTKTATTFGVATYHMPCQFRVPKVMVIHASLFTSWAQELAKGRSLVLCGDFNFQPGDAAYRLVTEGSILADDKDYPTPQDFDRSGWKPAVSPCASAYKQLKGTEPLYTNWARTARDDSEFIACLDYIFVHPAEAVATTEVLELPTTTDDAATMGPYPTENEPSDHIMIAASMRIRAQEPRH